MEVKLLRSIDDIDATMWDSILTDNITLKCAQHLRAVERSNIACGKYWYILFYEQGQLVGNTSLFTIETYIDEAASNENKMSLCDKIRAIYPNFLKIKILCCGSPIATCTNTLTVKAGIRDEILRHLIMSMKDIGKKESVHVLMLRDFNTQEAAQMDNVMLPMYYRVHSLPTTFLNVQWDTFEEFVSSFKSSAKAKIRRNMKKFNTGSFEVVIATDFGQYAVDMHKLYLNVYSKADDKFEMLPVDYFRNVSEYLGKQCKAILVFDKNNLIAFELIMYDANKIIPLYVGIDYAYNDEFMLYFNMIYQIVKLGIETCSKVIEIGQTCYYPKLKIGAVIGDLYMYIRFRNKLLNKFFAPVLPSMFPYITEDSVMGE